MILSRFFLCLCFVFFLSCQKNSAGGVLNAGGNQCDASEVCGGQDNACDASEVCDGQDNDCDNRIDETDPSLGQGCEIENGQCEIQGTLICEGGQLVCFSQGNMEVVEECNGLDDDCDAMIDEGFTLDGSGALIGEACIVGVGACENNGVVQCADAASTACSVESLEGSEELCNGQDDDCDGTTDEGFEPENPELNAGDACVVGVGACQSGGFVVCGADGSAPECNAVQGESSEEICDDLDNDCDGRVDEENPGGGAVCEFQNNPECGEGILTCEVGALVCKNDVPVGVELLCDEVDEDCDGRVDEGNPEGEQDCEVEGVQGVCVDGRTRCRVNGDNGGELICISRTFAGDELCDGQDNDCDGSVDEGNPGGGQDCRLPDVLGQCAIGTRQCMDGAFHCVANNADPQPEICDGRDNDCDGTNDEEIAGVGEQCDTGRDGICATGILRCRLGESICIQNNSAVAESCDGVDQDCDGTTDEDSPGVGANCGTGQQGVCDRGRIACEEGIVRCKRRSAPSAELCDNQDNDCDGINDEDIAGLGEACNTGQQGICSSGTLSCQAGQSACLRNVAPQPEVCDGLDQDCDGQVDEGNPGGGQDCLVEGAQGVCVDGEMRCVVNDDGASAHICVPLVFAGDEMCDSRDNDCDGRTDEGIDIPGGLDVCDGVDNDCDGRVDENDFFVGEVCDSGLPGVCAPGVLVCEQVNGVSRRSCNATIGVFEQIERCDGLDNDCDGELDEDFPGLGRDCETGLPGECAPGIRTECLNAQIICQAPDPVPEVCDGLDNDCDGRTDEQFSNPNPQSPGNNAVDGVNCNTEFQGNDFAGACRQGRWRCEVGNLICKPRAFDPGPASEVVGNGLDDDCDGRVDE